MSKSSIIDNLNDFILYDYHFNNRFNDIIKFAFNNNKKINIDEFMNDVNCRLLDGSKFINDFNNHINIYTSHQYINNEILEYSNHNGLNYDEFKNNILIETIDLFVNKFIKCFEKYNNLDIYLLNKIRYDINHSHYKNINKYLKLLNIDDINLSLFDSDDEIDTIIYHLNRYLKKI